MLSFCVFFVCFFFQNCSYNLVKFYPEGLKVGEGFKSRWLRRAPTKGFYASGPENNRLALPFTINE